MSAPPAPAPTSGSNPPEGIASLPSSDSRGIYTYSFLGAIGLVTALVLFFVGRSYSRRRRFALRVQQAIDSGRLDPRIAHEISNLPTGALYFSRSNKSRKKKVKPVMYEVRLGGEKCKTLGGGSDNSQIKGLVDWSEIMPIAVSKYEPPETEKPMPGQSGLREFTPRILRSTNTSSAPALSTHLGDSMPTNLATHLQTDNIDNVTTSAITPSTTQIALSVLISMPSPPLPSVIHLDEDAEAILPNVCFGVAQVDVVG